MSREPTKAVRYIQQLDTVRCNGDWEAVPELVRKVRKHAPDRKCLALTAECEHSISKASNGRPTTSNSLSSSEISTFIPSLAEAIKNETRYVEDEFQARTCLAWAYWVLGDHVEAIAQLPESIEQDFAQLDGTGKDSTAWTKVCALKASYIKGTSLSRTGSSAEALEAFDSVMPIVSTSIPSSNNGPELRTWTELLLTQFCMLSSRVLKSKLSSLLETETLTVFREWARFWEKQPGAPALPAGGYASQANVPRRQVWKEYYATLSTILQKNLPYPTNTMATAYADTSTRLQQRAELQRVEMRYELLLLKEISFPRAEQASEEVEEWVNMVMQNWKILCGNSWQEEELGQGGREAVSRGVLDILYKAATQTFHSTAILRHLFTVHLAVAEFDLAFKAFDTYLEIAKKSKARVEKSGEPEQGLDDDETFLKTTAECIRALCQYGSREAAEHASEIASFLQDWLNKHYSKDGDVSINGDGNGRMIQDGESPQQQNPIAPRVLAQAWRSIGISQAQWARLTFEASSRSEIQLDAVKSLRKALSKDYESTHDLESLFALALVLAERRELGTAIDVVKAALLPGGHATSSDNDSPQGKFARERSLIPLWHLLALLLSARQEFMTAARACEGAFEQFKDPANLFGEKDLNGAYRSEHLNQMTPEQNEKSPPKVKGIVDDMDDFEKEAVLEVKMTQLVLIEVMEGPEVAVNASDELLSLYARLFGEPQKMLSAPPRTTQTLMPPQSSAGTLRSIKGSIFGRSRRSIRKSSDPPGTNVLNEKTSHTARPQTSQTYASTVTRAPTIHVTTANGAERHPRHSGHHEKLQKRSGSLSRNKSQASQRSASATRVQIPTDTSSNTIADGAEIPSNDFLKSENILTAPAKDPEHPDRWQNSTSLNPVGMAMSPDNSEIERSLQPVYPDAKQDIRLPLVSTRSSFTNPVTRFAKDEERRRRLGILVQVWLLIAGFYRRAEMYGDSKGAVDEAEKLVLSLDTETSKDTSGKLSIDVAGWGHKKSVEEMWADVYSERGYLSIAKDTPYTALSDFESALVHFCDHPSATVGLSNILLDIYTEVLTPLPSIPGLDTPKPAFTPSSSTLSTSTNTPTLVGATTPGSVFAQASQMGPLGLATSTSKSSSNAPTRHPSASALEPPHKATSTALLDRLAARDRAYGLLSSLTKLGTGWNYSEAWFALARAYEEGGQVDKAREVLWWCVELEEGKGVRGWECVSVGGYVL